MQAISSEISIEPEENSMPGPQIIGQLIQRGTDAISLFCGSKVIKVFLWTVAWEREVFIRQHMRKNQPLDYDRYIVTMFDQINHCTVMDYFSDEVYKGPAIALEHIPHQSIGDGMRRCGGPVAPQWMKRTARGILNALRYVRSTGVVHMYLRPSNIYWIEDTDTQKPSHIKLSDFDKALLFEEVEECDRNCDLTGFGFTMYEMATGEPVPPSVVAVSETHMLDRVRERLNQILPGLGCFTICALGAFFNVDQLLEHPWLNDEQCDIV